MELKVKEIAKILDLSFRGNGDKIIKKVSSIYSSDENSICFIDGEIDKTFKAGCIIVKDIERYKDLSDSFIISENPKLSFSKLLYIVDKENKPKRNYKVSKTAIVNPNSKISNKSYIGDFVVIEEDSLISDDVIIESNVYIGKNVIIGKNTVIYPNVVIRENVKIGSNCIIHCGTVIGSDGFGYMQEDAKHIKIPQVGGVIIEDGVEIGSNVSIDRATIDNTIIGEGTKIDNLVHIAHNVVIGKNCLILAQVGIAGSTNIGNNVIIAGQAGITDHVNIEDNSVIMAQSGVIGNIKKGRFVFGTPARDRTEFMRIQAALSKLPEIYKYFIKRISND